MRNISIAFAGFNALQDVDFTLQGGSIHALVGANGAGKSTLMAILSGAHDHYRGEILIDGRAVEIHSPLQARRHGIHVVQQEVDVALIPTLSVAERTGPLAELGGTAPPRRTAAAAMGAAAQPAQTPGGLHAGGKTAGAAGARAVAPLPFSGAR
jgi:ABC-type sugar transport system ATPase subunit